MDADKVSFSYEWLSLDKKEFRVLALVADKGTFKGNLAEMCRYFSLDPQTNTKNKLRDAIQNLKEQGLIEAECSGRTYTLKCVPTGEQIEIPREWLTALRQHRYSSEAVSWEAVLKVLLWLSVCGDQIITNNAIAAALNISVSTVVAAKNVLQNEFAAITKEYISEKRGEDFFVRLGQKINVAAWWETA